MFLTDRKPRPKSDNSIAMNMALVADMALNLQHSLTQITRGMDQYFSEIYCYTIM